MATIQPQPTSDRLLEQIAKAVLATDAEGMFVCPFPGCNADVGYAVDDLVEHLWHRHRQWVLSAAGALTLLFLWRRR